MTVTEKFKNDSAIAAIRALRGLEQTAIMLETYAPEIFPETTEVNGVLQKHFGRVMMESAAQAIRESWANAIKETENSDRADQIADVEHLCLAAETACSNALDIDGCGESASVSYEHLNDLRAALVHVKRHTEAVPDRSAPPQAQEAP
jgi:hypothetical protein